MDKLEAKLSQLSEKMEGGREDQIAEVVSIKKILKAAMLKKNLKEHPALNALLDVLRKREDGFTIVLANKEDLTTEQRLAYFNRRKEVRFILSFFDSADKTIESIEKMLDYQLSEDINSTDSEDA